MSLTASLDDAVTLGARRRALSADLSGVMAAPAARLLLAASVVMAVISCAANLSTLDDLGGEPSVRLALHSATVPALVFSLVAGIYTTSTELRFGVIDQRLLTDPSRRRWLLSKVAVQAIVGFVYGVLGSAVALVTSAIIYDRRGFDFDLTSVVVMRSLAGVMVATVLFSVIGAAVGSLTANTPAALAAALVWVLVIEPPAVLGLPELGRWLPAAGALALTGSPSAGLFDQVPGGVVLVVWAAAGLAIGLHRIEQRDV